METLIGTAFALLFLCVMQLLVINTTERTKALAPWRPVLMFVALIWWATPIAKKGYVDEFFYPDDSVVHEAHARDIAYLIGEGDWEQTSSYVGVGNEGYRFVMGVFYFITGAPEFTIYEIHAMLAFWGLLCLLEMAAVYSRAERVPLWIALFFLLNPSALFWTTFNLKEGAMLWGICMTLRAAINLVDPDQEGTDSLFWAGAGLITAGFLRPHIVVAYLAAIAIGVAVRRGQAGWAFVAALGMVAGVAGLKMMAPGLYESVVADGLSNTLNDKFTQLSAGDGSVIIYASGAPIPLISGLVLLSVRPFPWEAFDLPSLVAGAEVWVITGIALMGWLVARNRVRLLSSSYMITHVVAFLALAFYFTYIYNMGLMVRQRVMVFPPMLTFAALPFLARHARQWSGGLLPTNARNKTPSAAPLSPRHSRPLPTHSAPPAYWGGTTRAAATNNFRAGPFESRPAGARPAKPERSTPPSTAYDRRSA